MRTWSAERAPEEAVVARRRIDEGDEIPMNYSFKRSQKGTGMMASRSQMERTPRGERVVVTRDEIIGKDGKPMNPRSSGKAYGLWRQRPVDADPDMQRQSADSRIKAKLAGSSSLDLQRARREIDSLRGVASDMETGARRGMSDMSSELRRYR